MRKAAALSTLAALVLVGGISAGTALHKDVTLTLDDQPIKAIGFALTVADVLLNNGITLSPEDEVSPPINSFVSDGEEIVVRFEKPVTLVIDGVSKSFLTKDATLKDALEDIPLSVKLDDAKLSVPQSTQLPRDGVTVIVSTEKKVSLSVSGEESEITTLANTVNDLLTERGVVVDSNDKLSHKPSDLIVEGDKITLDVVEIKEESRVEKVKFKTETRKNAKMWLGETKIIEAGKKGKANRVYKVTTVNGKTKSESLLEERIIAEPKTQIQERGTKVSVNGAGLNLAREATWDKIAKCESTNNWKINTGNGYYGGLQFSKSSWDSNGGRDFAAYPHLATREQQITVANRYYAKAGFRPWGCKP